MARDVDDSYADELAKLSDIAMRMGSLAWLESSLNSGSGHELIRYAYDGRTIAISFRDIQAVVERSKNEPSSLLEKYKLSSRERISCVEMEGSSIIFHLHTNSLWSNINGPADTGDDTKIDAFIHLYFNEIRSIICKTKKGNRNLGHATTGALAGLGAWLSHLTGVGGHSAEAVAAGILVAVMSAAKGAFCKMTAEEARATLRKPPAAKTDLILKPTDSEIIELQQSRGKTVRKRKPKK